MGVSRHFPFVFFSIFVISISINLSCNLSSECNSTNNEKFPLITKIENAANPLTNAYFHMYANFMVNDTHSSWKDLGLTKKHSRLKGREVKVALIDTVSARENKAASILEKSKEGSPESSEVRMLLPKTTITCAVHASWMAELIGGKSSIKSTETLASRAEIVGFNATSCLKNINNHKAIEVALKTAIDNKVDLISISLGKKIKKIPDEAFNFRKSSQHGKEDILVTTSMNNNGKAFFFQLNEWPGIKKSFSVGAFRYEKAFSLNILGLGNRTNEEAFYALPLSNSILNLNTSTSSYVTFFEKGFVSPSANTPELSLKDHAVLVQFDDPKCISNIINYAIRESALAVILLSRALIDDYAWSSIPIIYIDINVYPNFKNILRSYVKRNKKMRWSLNPRAYLFIAPKSSLGPHPDLSSIKPDIMAIGGTHFLQAPEEHMPSSYIGADIANARFTGMLAIYIEQLRKQGIPIKFEDTLIRMQNSATPYVYHSSQIPRTATFLNFRKENEEFEGFAAPVPWQGAGLVNLERMLTPTLKVVPSKLELRKLKSISKDKKKFTLIIKNETPSTLHVHLKHLPAVALKMDLGGYPVLKKEVARLYLELKNKKLLSFTSQEIKNYKFEVASKAQVEVKFLMKMPSFSKNEPHTFLSGYIVLQPSLVSQGKHRKYTSNLLNAIPPVYVPYLWMYGDRSTFPRVAHPYTYLTYAGKKKRKYYAPKTMNETLPYPIFRFHRQEFPLLCFELTVPMKNLSLVLVGPIKLEIIGTIQTLKNLSDLFFCLPYKRKLKTSMTSGWRGCYLKDGTKSCIKEVSYFRFCLTGVTVGANGLWTNKQSLIHCSTIFKVIPTKKEKKKIKN